MLELARVVEGKRKINNIRQAIQESNATSSEGVVRFKATRFGELIVAEDKIITFPNGVLGFPDAKRFIILDYEGDIPFKWFQAVDDPALAFLITDPHTIKPDYQLSLKVADLADLGEGDDSDMAVLVILTVPEGNPKGMTANLRGPLVANSKSMRGKQIVLQDERYSIKHPVFS